MRNAWRGTIIEEVLKAEPVDTVYVAGRWHHDRATLNGIRAEARLALRAMKTPPNRDVRKFLIVGRARSGTTLLTRSLDQHPDVTCDGEKLKFFLLRPAHQLEMLARLSQRAAYGAKLLTYQMIQVQRFKDPIGFLNTLDKRGFKLIHIRRDTFSVTMSWLMATTQKRFHSFHNKDVANRAVLDPARFLEVLKWNEKMLEYEEFCFRQVPHLLVDYDRDLLEPESQTQTVARVFDHIGVRPLAVEAPVKKLLSTDPRDVIENFDDVAAAIRSAGFQRLLPATVG